MSLLLSRRAAAKEDAPDVPPEFRCPITLDMMRDPVVGATGITYDRAAIEAWLLVRCTCPVSHGELRADDLISNHTLRRLIQAWCTANRSRGVERVPTPRANATPAHAADAVAEVESAASAGNAERCATAARAVRRLVKEAGRTRRCLASAGAARALATAFTSFSDAPAASNVLEDVLAALVLVMPMDEEAIAVVGSSSASVAWLITAAANGDPQRRLQAVVVLREIVSCACNGGGAGVIDLSANVVAVVEVVVRTIKGAMCPQATKACLVAAYHLARADDGTATLLVAAGLVSVLIELLVDANRSTAETALAALDAALASSDGRARVRADALAVPVLVKKMFRVSDTATELVVSSLWRICRKCLDDDMDGTTAAARRLPVLEALQVGALQKLVLLLQVGCREETKEKATELLRLMVRYQARGECIDTMDFRGLKRRDNAILIK